MFHLLQALTRWLAPIISFTAEEIWQAIPGVKTGSIFLETWYDAWPSISAIDMRAWEQRQAIRDEVNKALEKARQEGTIGSGLAASVVLYATPDVRSLLSAAGDELRFLFITSEATLKPLEESPESCFRESELGLAVEVVASSAPKCGRCWHRQPSVGENLNHPELCQRCVDNITGHDEVRNFA